MEEVSDDFLFLASSLDSELVGKLGAGWVAFARVMPNGTLRQLGIWTRHEIQQMVASMFQRRPVLESDLRKQIRNYETDRTHLVYFISRSEAPTYREALAETRHRFRMDGFDV